MTKELRTKQTDRRVLKAGTEWPFYHQLNREQVGARRPYWSVWQDVCDGQIWKVHEFRTRREAERYFDTLEGQEI